MPSKIASVQHSRGKSYQLREELPGGSVVETPQSPLEKQQLSLLLPCPSLSVWLHQPQESGCPLVSVCFSGHQLLHGPCRCSALVLGSVCCSRPRLPRPRPAVSVERRWVRCRGYASPPGSNPCRATLSHTELLVSLKRVEKPARYSARMQVAKMFP